MSILQCLSYHHVGMTLTELSREAQLDKATALRFLKSLANGGFVSVEDKAWKIGPAFLEIGARATNQGGVRDIARPIMERASQECGETVQLAILADADVVYVEKVESADQPLRINSGIGSRRPIHCTALGKVLSAEKAWVDVEKIIKTKGLEKFTHQTITDVDRFKKELQRISSQGYAIDDREYNNLVVCVAACVRDATGRAVAGLSISTFGISVESNRFKQLIETVKDVADTISADLGWHPTAGADTSGEAA